jgi:hypothetical protein
MDPGDLAVESFEIGRCPGKHRVSLCDVWEIVDDQPMVFDPGVKTPTLTTDP